MNFMSVNAMNKQQQLQQQQQLLAEQQLMNERKEKLSKLTLENENIIKNGLPKKQIVWDKDNWGKNFVFYGEMLTKTSVLIPLSFWIPHTFAIFLATTGLGYAIRFCGKVFDEVRANLKMNELTKDIARLEAQIKNIPVNKNDTSKISYEELLEIYKNVLTQQALENLSYFTLAGFANYGTEFLFSIAGYGCLWPIMYGMMQGYLAYETIQENQALIDNTKENVAFAFEKTKKAGIYTKEKAEQAGAFVSKQTKEGYAKLEKAYAEHIATSENKEKFRQFIKNVQIWKQKKDQKNSCQSNKIQNNLVEDLEIFHQVEEIQNENQQKLIVLQENQQIINENKELQQANLNNQEQNFK